MAHFRSLTPYHKSKMCLFLLKHCTNGQRPGIMDTYIKE